MLRYRQQNMVPPGSVHFYNVEKTGFYFEAHIMDDLIREVRDHLAANNLPDVSPEDLQVQIQDYVCRHVPESFCVGEEEANGKPRTRFFTIEQVRDFTKIMAGIGLNAVRGIPEASFVDQAEADRRAHICANCPANMSGICTTCNGLAGFSRTIVGRHRSTTCDAVLHVCENCGCLLRTKVHLSKDILKRGRGAGGNYPDHCWMHDVK